MDLKLTGLKAFITGSSQGLGYATAKTLTKEGAVVCINSRNKDKLSFASKAIFSETGSNVFSTVGDVNEVHTADLVVKEAAKLMGGIDILITNSGGPPPGEFESFSDEIWQKAIEASFLSHMRLIRSSLSYLRRSRNASVLTITSISAKQPIPNLILSNSIRAATVGLTKSLSLELGVDGIRFNSILPGWTKTERVTELLSNRSEINQTTFDEELTKLASGIPLRRLAEVEEFANVAVFLVSPIASYITGVSLPIDGGMNKGIM